MNLFEKTGILPKAGMLLRHQSGYESRLVRDWGRVPEHWDAVVEDRATRLILLDEARAQGTEAFRASVARLFEKEG